MGSYLHLAFQGAHQRFHTRVESNTDNLISHTLEDLNGAISIANSLIGNQIISLERGGMFFLKNIGNNLSFKLLQSFLCQTFIILAVHFKDFLFIHYSLGFLYLQIYFLIIYS